MSGPGFVIGNIAKGKDLWDRDAEIGAVWHALEKSSVLLKAPRRFRKTSIMYRIYEQPQSGWTVFFHDTEGMRSPEDFISRTTAKVLEHLTVNRMIKTAAGWVMEIVQRIEEIGVAEARLKIRQEIESDWQEKGLELISLLRNFDGPVLFILDELPVLIQNIAKKSGDESAGDFLHWFRSVRQTPELSHVRWLVGGSIGIEHVVDKVGVGAKAINDFHILGVGPFSLDDGTAYIKALLDTEGGLVRVSSQVLGKMRALLGAHIPYFVQILVYESLNEMRKTGKSLSEAVVETAYQAGVLGSATRTYFEHYFTRLRDYYDPQIEHVAKGLLLEVARRSGVSKADLFRLFGQLSEGQLPESTFSYLMTDLENDFYVAYEPATDTYRFTTNILRDWWLRYYDLVEE